MPMTGHSKNPPRAWQRMLSGRRLDLLNPSPLDIEISDIAHGLARVARWNGQTTGIYPFSVAQHSLLVESLIGELKPKQSTQTHLASLLHDAAEYVIGDIISPFKAVVGNAYITVEARLMQAIHTRFSLPSETPKTTRGLIKKADRIAAYLESVHLAGFEEKEAKALFAVPPENLNIPEHLLIPLPTHTVEQMFSNRVNELMG